jgi:hypothetical protein
MQVVIEGFGNSVSAADFNGQALTAKDRYFGATFTVETWYRLNPDVANSLVSVSFTGTVDAEIATTSYVNVDQASPFGWQSYVEEGSASTLSQTATTTVNQSILLNLFFYPNAAFSAYRSGQSNIFTDAVSALFDVKGDQTSTVNAGSYNLYYDISASGGMGLHTLEIRPMP